MRLLLEANANTDTLDIEGFSLLHIAVVYEMDSAVTAFIDFGVSVCARDKDGDTPLHIAVQNQVDKAIINQLLAAGADLFECNDRGISPLSFGITIGNDSLKKHVVTCVMDVSSAEDLHKRLGCSTRKPPPDVMCMLLDPVYHEEPDGPFRVVEAMVYRTLVRFVADYGTKRNESRDEAAVLELLVDPTTGLSPHAMRLQLMCAVRRGNRPMALTLYDMLYPPVHNADPSKLKVDANRVLGAGAFGVVHAGEYDGQTVAVKVTRQRGINLRSEVALLTKCRCPYVLPLLAVAGPDNAQAQMVLPLMDAGDLAQYLQAKREGRPTTVNYSMLEVAWVIAHALWCLHDRHVMHRDLKSNNVFVCSKNYIKVGDLGEGKDVQTLMTTGVGTIQWTAPEVLVHGGKYSCAADIYSLGVIFTELDTQQPPYANLGLTQYQILDGVAAGTLRPTIRDDCAPWKRDLINACLNHNPSLRPTAKEVVDILAKHMIGANPPLAGEKMADHATMDEEVKSDVSCRDSQWCKVQRCARCTDPAVMLNAGCPDCGADLPSVAEKLQFVAHQVANLAAHGAKVHTNISCDTCQEPNPIAATVDGTLLARAVKATDRYAAERWRQAIKPPAHELIKSRLVLDYTQPLGQGALAAVYRAVYMGQDVAVKRSIRMGDGDHFHKEARLLTLCVSPYIVPMIALDSNEPMIVLPYMDGGELRRYLGKKRDNLPTEVDYSTIEVAWVVANALQDMHHRGVVHRNITSSNVHLCSKNYIKVASLGFAKELQSQMTEGVGTLFWMAPETLSSEGDYIYAADIYSFGVVLTELDTLRLPYHEKDFDNCAPWLRSLIDACLQHDPSLRPTAKAIVELLQPRMLEEQAARNRAKRSELRSMPRSSRRRQNHTEIADAVRSGQHERAHELQAKLYDSFPLEVAFQDVIRPPERPLGIGGYAHVHRGTYGSYPVAIKQLNDGANAQSLQNEARLLQACRSPYLVPLLAVVTTSSNDPPALLLELMDAGDLYDHLERKRRDLPTTVGYSSFEVALVVAHALVDMHARGVVHRDLKSHNILLCSKNYIKVADLGISTTAPATDVRGNGTTGWMAPEVLEDWSAYSPAADIYSFGVVLTELDTMHAPYAVERVHDIGIRRGVVAGTLRPSVSPGCAPWMRTLIDACLQQDPSLRPTAQQVVTILTEHIDDARRPLAVDDNESDAMPREEACIVITCIRCTDPAAMLNDVCPDCKMELPSIAEKVQFVAHRVAGLAAHDARMRTDMLCYTCQEANPITNTACHVCAEPLLSDKKKLSILIRRWHLGTRVVAVSANS
ncbi:protein kinase [Achlya hypogyna]|uniref:Protein kinase n=1 Tax=Achlya hypogyna TaxID=1202772 RepID=A0A1V9Z7Q9_ACHHY|nr:protein kinase [Achlya hypogyna]